MIIHPLIGLGLLLASRVVAPALPAIPLIPPPAPCTTFCLPGQKGPVFARNYDWAIGVGLVIVNKRDLAKTALIRPPDIPVTWVSKYGSLTFNQYGRDLPMGGINEAGLVVETMWLQETRYPPRDERPALRELAWIQYQLDNCRNIDEVLATDVELRISGDSVPIHFLVCDPSGDCATVEFLEGQMVVHRGVDLLIPALANSSFSDSIEYLEKFSSFGGDRVISKSPGSLDRFVRAACGVVDYVEAPAQATADYAFRILENVSQGPATQWSMVYDLRGLAVRFKTSESPAIKIVRLADFDFSPSTPCLVLDIDAAGPGDVHELFADYTTEANRKLILESWRNTPFLADTPEELLNQVAEHPESIVASSSKQDS